MIFLDFETRSYCDLRQEGGWRYAEHETSELLCGVALDTRPAPAVVYVWSPWAGPLRGWNVKHDYLQRISTPPESLRYAEPLLESDDPHQEILDAASQGVPFVAHHAGGFDRLVWDAMGLPAARWLDSVPRAKRRGLPGHLEGLAQRLYGVGKDKIGRKTMLVSSVPHKRTGELVDPDGPRLSSIVRYCIADVLLMAAAWQDEGLGDPHPDDATLEAHWQIDRRGVLVDAAAVAALLEAEQRLVEESVARAAAVTRGEVTLRTLRSPAALGRWLASRGYPVPDTRSQTIQGILDEDN